MNQHAQWHSLRVVDPQIHEGRGGRAETRWHCEPSHTQGKFDGFQLTVACRQVSPAVARLRDLPPAPWPEVHRLSAARGSTRRRVRIFTRTLCHRGHACALHSLQLMAPGERATHNPAPRCVQGIVSINASDLGPFQKGAPKNTLSICRRTHTVDRAQPYTPSDAGKTRQRLRGSKHGPMFGGGDEVDAYVGFFSLQVFFHCKEKGPKTHLYGALFTRPAHNKSDGFMLTSSCGQTAPAIARLKA